MSTSDTEDFELSLPKMTLKFRIVTLENGFLVMISDSPSFRLGQSAVSVPSGQAKREPTSMAISAVGPDAMTVRTIAERISAWTGSMCMLIMAVKDTDRVVVMEIVNALKNHFVT